jgi:hypothetical protein
MCTEHNAGMAVPLTLTAGYKLCEPKVSACNSICSIISARTTAYVINYDNSSNIGSNVHNFIEYHAFTGTLH